MCMKRIPKIVIQEREGELFIKIKCSCNDEDNSLVYDIDDYIKKLKENLNDTKSNQAFCIDCHSVTNSQEDHLYHKLYPSVLTLDNHCYEHDEVMAEYYCYYCSLGFCKECLNNHLYHSHYNFLSEASTIDIQWTKQELEKAIKQFNCSITTSNSFLSQLHLSDHDKEKQLKANFNSMIKQKIKENKALISLALLALNTYQFLFPLTNRNLLYNVKHILPNHKDLHLAYAKDEDNLKVFTSFYKRNYILYIKMENEYEIIKQKEPIQKIITLRNGDVALLTKSQILRRYDANCISLICELPKAKINNSVSNLIELRNGKIIGKANEEVLVIWDFVQLTCEAFAYPSSFHLHQLSTGLVLSFDWNTIYLYNVDTMQINTQLKCKQFEALLHYSCLELVDGRIVIASKQILFLDKKSLQKKGHLSSDYNVYEIKQWNADSILVLTGFISKSLVIIDVNQMTVLRAMNLGYSGLGLPSQHKRFVFYHCKNYQVGFNWSLDKQELIKTILINYSMEYKTFGRLKDGRLVIAKEDSILFMDNFSYEMK